MAKLSYEEYMVACETGLFEGSPCCCMGPQDNDEYCPCLMRILDRLTDDGQEKIKAHWKANKILSKTELQALYDEDEIEQSPYRKRRIELLAKKNTKG
jgi:hypothetical protein